MHKTIINLKKIENQLKTLDPQKGLNFSKIKIIAVSKTFPVDQIKPLIESGHIHFGENKIQEARSKWIDLKEKYPEIKLHMLGKIQTNKVKYILPLFDYIHSLDNLKLAKLISNIQLSKNLRPKIFIQINIGGEEQKSGIKIDYLKTFYHECVDKLRLDIVGFMCIPPNKKKPTEYFKLMKKFKENFSLEELSMGMSGDYMEAINYGATFLRLGSILFGKRN